MGGVSTGCVSIEGVQNTTCGSAHFILLMMGIMMSETCWDRSLIINIRLIASCWFLSLQPTFVMHGHKSLKFANILLLLCPWSTAWVHSPPSDPNLNVVLDLMVETAILLPATFFQQFYPHNIPAIRSPPLINPICVFLSKFIVEEVRQPQSCDAWTSSSVTQRPFSKMPSSRR